jgi:hypothetical protein
MTAGDDEDLGVLFWFAAIFAVGGLLNTCTVTRF